MYKLVKKGFLLSILLSLGLSNTVYANDGAITEGSQYLSTGTSLTDEEFSETVNLLGAEGVPEGNRIKVKGSDIHNYTNNGSNDDSLVYSSAYLEFKEEGYGVKVTILKPENITEVTAETYQNAAVTAGANNVDIRIVNVVVPVNGRGALAGIYKILETYSTITKEDISYAELEIGYLQNIISREEGNLSQTEVNGLVAKLKTDVIEGVTLKGGITKEEMEGHIKSRMDEFGIELTAQTESELLDILMNFSQTEAALDTRFLSTLNLLGGEVLSKGSEAINSLDSEFKVGQTQISSKGVTINPIMLAVGVGAVILSFGTTFLLLKAKNNKKKKPRTKRRR